LDLENLFALCTMATGLLWKDSKEDPKEPQWCTQRFLKQFAEYLWSLRGHPLWLGHKTSGHLLKFGKELLWR
jgi:hypothetical protein